MYEGNGCLKRSNEVNEELSAHQYDSWKDGSKDTFPEHSVLSEKRAISMLPDIDGETPLTSVGVVASFPRSVSFVPSDSA